jgi:hypothetical protein
MKKNVVKKTLPLVMALLQGIKKERKKDHYFLNNSTNRHTILFVNNTKLYNIHMAEKLVNKNLFGPLSADDLDCQGHCFSFFRFLGYNLYSSLL